jgi:hypothetical protein
MNTLSRNLLLCVTLAVCFTGTGSALAQSSANYELTRSVMSGGGARSTSANYDLTGTLGQPSTVDVSESENYNLGSGFWGATVRMFTVAIQSITYTVAESVRITWQSFADATYTIYYADALSFSTVWTFVATLPGTGGLMEWLDDGSETGAPPSAAGILRRFYRLGGQP